MLGGNCWSSDEVSSSPNYRYVDLCLANASTSCFLFSTISWESFGCFCITYRRPRRIEPNLSGFVAPLEMTSPMPAVFFQPDHCCLLGYIPFALILRGFEYQFRFSLRIFHLFLRKVVLSLFRPFHFDPSSLSTITPSQFPYPHPKTPKYQ